ncbi:MAG TPA: sigma-70 family RNA polymerase sigma factor [Anaerolineales bacterium]|nr:sigma-70 family RNA polymerase sigma factor [Anaerolineales bacterium]
MEWNEAAISEQIEIALENIKPERGAKRIAALRPILAANLARGRVRKFLDSRTVRDVGEYVRRVADGYEALHDYIRALQIDRDEEAWTRLLNLMAKRLFGYLCRKGFPASDATRDAAAAGAQEAARRVLNAHFPYDTEFTPWLYVILQFTGAGIVRDTFKTEHIDIAGIDETLTDPGSESGRQIEKRLHMDQEILNAVERLAPARRTVIVRYYFEGKSFEEIAVMMERSVNAVYQLHFYALKDLRRHLDG